MIRIQKEPIELTGLFDDITPETGAVVLFVGVVRADGMDHLLLESDTKEAERELGVIIAEAKERWGEFTAKVVHRYGKLMIGEVIVLIAVTSGHRDAAFGAARYIIDEIKVRVPIWKADVFKDSVSWIHGEKEQGNE